MIIRTRITGGETVAEAGIGLIMKGIEEGTGNATAVEVEVAAEVLTIAKNAGEEDMTTRRGEVDLLTEALLLLVVVLALEGAHLHAERLLQGAEVL